MHEFTAEVWRWKARQDGWFFVTLPEDLSDEIDAQAVSSSRGFGSVKVEVLVGGTLWRTSVFPDTARGAYVLPLKKAVRDREGIGEGDAVEVQLAVVDPTVLG